LITIFGKLSKKSLDFSRNKRPTAKELAEDLDNWQKNRPTRYNNSRWQRLKKGLQRNSAGIVLGTAIIGALGYAGYTLWGNRISATAEHELIAYAYTDLQDEDLAEMIERCRTHRPNAEAFLSASDVAYVSGIISDMEERRDTLEREAAEAEESQRAALLLAERTQAVRSREGAAITQYSSAMERFEEFTGIATLGSDTYVEQAETLYAELREVSDEARLLRG